MAKEEAKLAAVPALPEVESAVLHSAIMIGGKTEAHLGQNKLPGVKLGWVRGEGLSIEYKGKNCLVPSAGLKAVYFK